RLARRFRGRLADLRCDGGVYRAELGQVKGGIGGTQLPAGACQYEESNQAAWVLGHGVTPVKRSSCLAASRGPAPDAPASGSRLGDQTTSTRSCIRSLCPRSQAEPGNASWKALPPEPAGAGKRWDVARLDARRSRRACIPRQSPGTRIEIRAARCPAA